MRKCLVFIVIAVTLSTADGSLAQTAETLNEAKSLLRDGKKGEALDILKRTARTTAGSESAKLLNAQGWIAYTDGRYAQALSNFQTALDLVSQDRERDLYIKIQNNIGLVYFVEGQLDEAREAFRRSQELDSELASRYLGYIDRQAERQRFNRLVNRGIQYRQDRDFNQAITLYSKALAINPNDARALEYRGYAYFREREYDSAMADLDKSYSIDPSRITTIINIIKVLCAEKKYDDMKAFADTTATPSQSARKVIFSDQELQRTCEAWPEGQDLLKSAFFPR
jgi:tetratricopeptide (TPR) repeat protein